MASASERNAAPGGHHELVRLAIVTGADLPLLEQLVRGVPVKSCHIFYKRRQPRRLLR